MAVPALAQAPAPEIKILPPPQEYLKLIAGDDYDLLNRVIMAESGWHINAHNPTSSASGLAQYLDGTFKSFCIDKYHLTNSMLNKNDPYIQLDCMVRMVNDGGISHWNASKKYWEIR